MFNSNQLVYSRERKRFGRQCQFSDRNVLMLNIMPSRMQRLNYILRNPINAATQLSDQKALSVMETENVSYSEHGLYHFEGGWPKDVNLADEESTMRHRKKIERDDNWGIEVMHCANESFIVSDQNNSVNIYEEFFAEFIAELGEDIKTLFESRQKNIFHDPMTFKPRPITNIDWMPNDKESFMILYTNIPLQRAVEIDETAEIKEIKETKEEKTVSLAVLPKSSEMAIVTGNAFYIWNLDDPLKPRIVFDSEEKVRKALFCPKDETNIAAGLNSGKVCLWNSRLGGMALATCPLEAAHRETATSVCWVHSKTNTEFYTGSLDGSIKYWDGRNLKEPMQEVLLDPEMTDEQLRERAHGVTVLEFEYTIPIRFIAGSDMGSIFVGNRKGMTPMETFAAGSFRLFYGPIRTIERNPFFVKNFLITGDWCAKIWAEECKAAPLTFCVKKKSQLLCGTWSTMRCSLFVTGDAKGELDFWDLLLSQRQSIFTVKFSSPVLCAKFRSDGEFLAVCLGNGDVHILELDPAMKSSTSKDKALIAAMFEREQLRSKFLEGRVEETKLKRRLTAVEEEEAKSALTKAKSQEEPLDPNNPDDFLRIIASDVEFKESLNTFHDQVLKMARKRQDRQCVMELTDFESVPTLTPQISEAPEQMEEEDDDDIL